MPRSCNTLSVAITMIWELREISPIACQEIGVALAHLYPITLYKVGTYIQQTVKLTAGFEQAINGDSIELEKQPLIQDTMLAIVGYSRGKRIEPLLKDVLGLELDKDWYLKQEVREAVYRIGRNSNSILGSYAKENLMESQERLDIYGKPSKPNEKEITEIIIRLENNLHESPYENLPSITAALVELHGQDKQIDFDKKVNELKQKLFKGHDRLSIFERYEENLLRQSFKEYVKSKGYKNENELTTQETQCKQLIQFIEHFPAFESANDKEKYDKLRVELHEKLRELDSSLLSKMVTAPLSSAKVKFTKDFADLAPSGKRREYIDIALNKFELSKQLNYSYLEQILSLSEMEK